MADLETLLSCRLADPDPGDISLSDMLDALGAVDVVVDLPLEHRLEVLLHLSAGNLDHDAQGQRAALSHVVDLGSMHRDLGVLDLGHLPHAQVLERLAAPTAELDLAGSPCEPAHPRRPGRRPRGSAPW